MHQSRPFNSQSVHDPLWWVALCLPLKSQGIMQKKIWRIRSDPRGPVFPKKPKNPRSSPKAQEVGIKLKEIGDSQKKS